MKSTKWSKVEVSFKGVISGNDTNMICLKFSTYWKCQHYDFKDILVLEQWKIMYSSVSRTDQKSSLEEITNINEEGIADTDEEDIADANKENLRKKW